MSHHALNCIATIAQPAYFIKHSEKDVRKSRLFLIFFHLINFYDPLLLVEITYQMKNIVSLYVLSHGLSLFFLFFFPQMFSFCK